MPDNEQTTHEETWQVLAFCPYCGADTLENAAETPERCRECGKTVPRWRLCNVDISNGATITRRVKRYVTP